MLGRWIELSVPLLPEPQGLRRAAVQAEAERMTEEADRRAPVDETVEDELWTLEVSAAKSV